VDTAVLREGKTRSKTDELELREFNQKTISLPAAATAVKIVGNNRVEALAAPGRSFRAFSGSMAVVFLPRRRPAPSTPSANMCRIIAAT